MCLFMLIYVCVLVNRPLCHNQGERWSDKTAEDHSQHHLLFQSLKHTEIVLTAEHNHI